MQQFYSVIQYNTITLNDYAYSYSSLIVQNDKILTSSRIIVQNYVISI